MPRIIMDDVDAVFADHERTQASREDAGRFIVAMATRYGLTTMEVMSFMAEVQEELGTAKQMQNAECRMQNEGRGNALPLFKAEIVSVFEEILRADGAGAFLKVRQVLYALDDPALDDLLGHQTPADWFHAEDKAKFTVFKAVDAIQERLKLPRRKDRRALETRLKQAEKRNSQLTRGEGRWSKAGVPKRQVPKGKGLTAFLEK